MSSIQERAADELKRANFETSDKAVLLGIMSAFFHQWDSGGAVSVMISVLTRLLEGKPLTPLTGDWDEWVDMSETNGGEPLWQNLRCSSVFKRPVPDGDGATWAYDIDAPGLREGWRIDRPPIQFPYMPGESSPQQPIASIMMVAGDVSEAEMIAWRHQPITWMGRMDPSGYRVGPLIENDPIMGAIDAIRSYVCEQRDLNAQLAAQVVAEGEHTAAANAEIDRLKQSKGWIG